MLQRMLIDKMENRILVGIVMFLGTMLLVGWVAINENARMASFERQFTARSIERGADLFAANCSTCHGESGLGINGRAPGLNNPQLFGHDYFADIDRQLNALVAQQTAQSDELNTELVALADELVSADTTEERATEIEARIGEINLILNSDGDDELSTQIADLEAQKRALVLQFQPLILSAQFPLTIDENGDIAVDSEGQRQYAPSRLAQIGYGGTLESYIVTTLIHGRPGSSAVWPAAMVSWSDRTGGPLRDDQIQDITNYILNFDKGEDWTVEDAFAVNQYSLIPVNPLLAGDLGEPAEPAGTDVDAILTELEGLEGDAERGQRIYSGTAPTQVQSILGCAGCHAGGLSAPATEEQWDNIPVERLTLPQFADYTIEHYIVESIVNPGAYVAPGYAAGAMPGNFGSQVSVQDLADMIAYIASYSTE
ncbi:MAG: c-type cytochrome [Aggregatilineales bacterium]